MLVKWAWQQHFRPPVTGKVINSTWQELTILSHLTTTAKFSALTFAAVDVTKPIRSRICPAFGEGDVAPVH